jgi:glycerol-3-phosphate dehydrogenase
MKSRIESLQLASKTVFDVLVIGGGIIGAGVAQRVASAGLSVLLIDKGDFAGGASGATNQWLGAGIGYIQGQKAPLCRQMSAETAYLEKSAPHLIRRINFVVPLPKQRPLLDGAACLKLLMQEAFTWTAGSKHHFRQVGWQATLKAAPALSAEGLQGSLQFEDCLTDDARLVLSIIDSACQQGAVAINYVEAQSFVTKNGVVDKVQCHDRYSSEEFAVHAKMVVNASGASIDAVCRQADAQWQERIEKRRSIQIVVRASSFETNAALCLQDKDDYILVAPWHHALLIGRVSNSKNAIDVNCTIDEEVDSMLQAINCCTNTHRLQRDDVTGILVGIKPLLKHNPTDSKTTSFPACGHTVFDGPLGLINVLGNNLCDFRAAADAVMNRIARQLPSAQTANVAQQQIFGIKNKSEFLMTCAEATALGRKLSLDPATIEHLLANYGENALVILAIVERDSTLAERLLPDYTPIAAEIIFAVQHEMAGCLQDFLLRRTRLGLINRKKTLQAAPRVAEIMQQLLDWDKKRLQAELAALEELLADLVPGNAGYKPVS